MADLGSIGFDLSTGAGRAVENIDVGADGLLAFGYGTALVETPGAQDGNPLVLVGERPGRVFVRAPDTETLEGVANENGSPFAGVRIRAFRRDNGELVAETVSAGDGSFTLKVLGYAGPLTVVAYDPDGGESYNALVFDKV